MLNPHLNMHCLNVVAQINLENVNYHVEFSLVSVKSFLGELHAITK